MRRLLLLLPLVLILAGCLSEEDQLVGKWRGKVTLSPMVQSMAGSKAGGIAAMADPQLDLRPDKTFVLSVAVASIEGTWQLKDKEIVLTPNDVNGVSADKARSQAQDAMSHMPAGMPLPFGMGGVANTKELHVQILDKTSKLVLDPGSGTLFGALGKMTFTKV